jgi:hypothetical protein
LTNAKLLPSSVEIQDPAQILVRPHQPTVEPYISEHLIERGRADRERLLPARLHDVRAFP